ncbi:hypothetical protein [Alteromonas sp. BMJM2]|uniref:hypothetical protein n=1 Tax=Alteromonas sp. BMJM2 TaxID=2954241 RepID=UPI0022B5D180|nr:hypothetical protein [Alteromonas sp. BMJM2]
MRTILLTLFIASLSLSNIGNAKTMEMPPGLWEGIADDELTFRLLEITDSDEHYFYEIVIPGGLKKVRRTAFTNNDIKCIENRCTINTIIEDNVTRTLTLSPYLGIGFSVLESSYKGDDSYLSRTYRLVKQEAKSTPRKFVENRKHLILDAEKSLVEHPYGTWVGVMQYLDKPELALLQLNEHKQGTLSVYSKGTNTFQETQTHFSPDNVSINGKVIEIEASHTTFASNILLFVKAEGMIHGYTYALHKGYPAGTGEIKLYRIKNQ